MPSIKIKIFKKRDKPTEIEGVGFSGNECIPYIEKFTSMGKVVEERRKSDTAFVQKKTEQQVEQEQGGE